MFIVRLAIVSLLSQVADLASLVPDRGGYSLTPLHRVYKDVDFIRGVIYSHQLLALL